MKTVVASEDSGWRPSRWRAAGGRAVTRSGCRAPPGCGTAWADRMTPPIADVCRYISFQGPREALTAAQDPHVVPEARLAPDHQRIIRLEDL